MTTDLVCVQLLRPFRGGERDFASAGAVVPRQAPRHGGPERIKLRGGRRGLRLGKSHWPSPGIFPTWVHTIGRGPEYSLRGSTPGLVVKEKST
eukprot:3915845-Pyramimonas_sp.AAC.1